MQSCCDVACKNVPSIIMRLDEKYILSCGFESFLTGHALEQPWDQGFELAVALHEALEGEFAVSTSVDLEKVIHEFGIAVTEIDLDDTAIRALHSRMRRSNNSWQA